MKSDQSDKTVLITAAAGVSGRATVTLLLNMVGSDRVDRSSFGNDFPENGLFIEADISEPQDLEAIFSQAELLVIV